MKLNKREASALREISAYGGRYSEFWTPKTNESLEAKGLVMIASHRVRITQAGIDHLGK